MSSILKEFTYGNTSPEVRFLKRNRQCGVVMRALSDNEEKLLARRKETKVSVTRGELVAGEEDC